MVDKRTIAPARGAASLLVVALLLITGCSNPEKKKQQYFESGNKYFAAKQYDHAIVEYSNALRIDPKFGQAHVKLAESYEQTRNVGGAMAEYIRAADALPDDRDLQVKATTILLLVRRFEDAKVRATQLVAKDPKDADALLLLANANAQLKETDAAVKQIEEAIKIRPEDSSGYINLAVVKGSGGNDKEAESAFRRAIALTSSVRTHLAFANYLISVGRFDESEAEIRQALAIDAKDPLANRMLAMVYTATNRVALAEAPLKTIAQQNPADISSQLILADYYLNVRQYPKARDVLTPLLANPQAFADAQTRLAQADYSEKHSVEAHQKIDEVLKRAPKYAPALTLKAQWLVGEGKLDDGLKYAQSATEAAPESAFARYVLAAAHDQRGEANAAIEAYKQTLSLNPRAVLAQVQLSRLSLAGGNPNAAVQYAELAKQTAPGRPDARLLLARSLLARGEQVRAEREISDLMAAMPNSYAVHTLNGAAHLKRGDVAGAKVSFEKALELNPTSTEALAGVVLIDLREKQVARAVARVDAQLAKRPDDSRLLALAGQVYGAAGDMGKAEKSLRRAVTIDPKFTDGYALLGRLYLSQNRLEEARAEYAGIVQRDPKADGPRTLVGVILQMQKKPEEAKAWYEAAIAANDKLPVVANNLAYMYAESGTKLDEALNLATTAKQGLPNDPNVSDTLGWVYYKRNMHSMAVRPLEESVKAQPDNASSQYHLGMTYAKLGNKEKAREALEAALKLNPQFPGAEEARSTLASLGK